ncbi:unnamed protein product [Hanseniaspora opuntiae]
MSSSEYESDYGENAYENNTTVSPQNEDEIFQPIQNVNIFSESRLSHNSMKIVAQSDNKRKIYFLGLMILVVKKGSVQFGQRIINQGEKFIKLWQSSAKTLKPLILLSEQCEIMIHNPLSHGFENTIHDYTRAKFKYLFRDDQIDLKLNFFGCLQILPPTRIKKYRTYDQGQNQNFIRVVDEIVKSVSQELPKLTICLGGKNSGKTTFNEMLCETYANEGKDIEFLDFDPGQQLFGFPGCVSRTRYGTNYPIIQLGDSLAPSDDYEMENYMIGSFDCMDYYTSYEEKTLMLIDKISSLGKDVVVNMPGWLTGLGTQFIEIIVNKVIELDSFDLKIVNLGDKESFLKLNIYIDVDYFISNTYAKYYAPGYKNSALNNGVFFEQLNWTSGDLREYRLLRSLHNHNNNRSILNQPTYAVSIGNEVKNIAWIKITQYLGNTPSKNEEMTCFKTLPGSIVAISFFDFTSSTPSIQKTQSVFQEQHNVNERMICLGVVHSIDVTNGYINLIIPSRYMKRIDKLNLLEYKYGKLQTMAVGLPSYEFLPVDEDVIRQFKGQIPYTTDRALKKNEHTWKVRKNIQRKSHQ